MKPKFKVGDIVRGKPNPYLITDERMTKGEVLNVSGNYITVEVLEHEIYEWTVGSTHRVEARYFELVSDTKVEPITKVIYDNNDTIVYWSDGTKTKVTCQTGDRYDKEKGLAMAIAKKYLGNGHDYYETFKKHLTPKYYSGRVVCIEQNNTFVTLGKIYEFKNGVAVDDRGRELPFISRVTSVEDLNRKLYSKFLEIKEDK